MVRGSAALKESIEQADQIFRQLLEATESKQREALEGSRIGPFAILQTRSHLSIFDVQQLKSLQTNDRNSFQAFTGGLKRFDSASNLPTTRPFQLES